MGSDLGQFLTGRISPRIKSSVVFAEPHNFGYAI